MLCRHIKSPVAWVLVLAFSGLGFGQRTQQPDALIGGVGMAWALIQPPKCLFHLANRKLGLLYE
ncbi:MAG: hypothetical protein LLF96_03965 [Eubacteriales bacterium]|nr:hypothetical protein [Eubacteriales bacterium]